MSFHSQKGAKNYSTHPGGVLILGDCIDVMRCMPSRSVDFILTDPPYLIDYKSRDGRGIENDIDDAWLAPAFQEAFRLLKPNSFCVSFYGWSKCDRFMNAWKQAGFHIVGHLTFVKSYSSKQTFVSYCHENAFLLAKGDPEKPQNPINDVFRFEYTGNKLHPTQKPVEPLRQLIRSFSKSGDVVLDPFSGSGSTAIAARLENREFLMVEKMQEYFDITQRRLAKTVSVPPIKHRPVKRPSVKQVD
ncbi:MAG: DNA methyltransferase [Cyanobacteria bacterium P01_C01_bin.121]